MIGNCENEIKELKVRTEKCEDGQIALGESQIELKDQTDKYMIKTDESIADSKF